MATLHLRADKATPPERPGDNPGWILTVQAFPPERAEIKNAADAIRAMADYSARVTATGAPAYVYANLAARDRAPAGFKRLNLGKFVNVDGGGTIAGASAA